jgi:hypothetical protein
MIFPPCRPRTVRITQPLRDEPLQVEVGQLDHPVEAHEAGPGSMDKPLKSGPAWKSAERVLAHNLKLHNPSGKNEAEDLNRGPVVTK